MIKHKYLIFVVCFAIVASGLFFFIKSSDDASETPNEIDAQASSESAPNDASEFAITGQVTDGLTHNALAASVSLSSSDQNIQTAACSDSGSFRFNVERDNLDNYSISAYLDGYVTRGKNDDGAHAIVIDDENNENSVAQNIELWPESKIVGRIVDDNSGVSAKINLVYQKDASGAENYDFKSVSTSEDGEFSFDMAYAGTAKLVITADGFSKQTLSDIVLEPGKTEDLGDIPLFHAVSLSGTVFDQKTQNPLQNVKIQVIENGEVMSNATSDENGVYQLNAAYGDQIALKTSAEGYKDTDVVIPSNGKTDLQYDIYLTPIEGIVLKVNNITGRKPEISTITVTDIASEKLIYQKELKNGSYELTELTDGPYLFTAVSADGETSAFARATGGNVVTLTLKPYGKINAKFNIIPSDAQFIKGKYQYTYDSDDGLNEIKGWFEIAEDAFSVENLKPGTYKFEAEAKDSKSDKWKKYKSKAIHIDMGDTEFVDLTPADPIEVVLCQFPDDASPAEMKKAVASCYDKADETLEMLDAYLSNDSFSDNPSNDLSNYVATAGEMLTKILPAYTSIISRTDDPEVKIASTYKLGSAFEKVANYITSAPIPADLSPEGAEQYRQIVSAYAAQYYNKASENYNLSVTNGAEFNINSEFVTKATERLAAINSAP